MITVWGVAFLLLTVGCARLPPPPNPPPPPPPQPVSQCGPMGKPPATEAERRALIGDGPWDERTPYWYTQLLLNTSCSDYWTTRIDAPTIPVHVFCWWGEPVSARGTGEGLCVGVP